MNRSDFITHVKSHQRAFRRFLTALCCGDTSMADDIAQEAYIKAYLSCEGFRDAEKFNAWIMRIGYNAFIDHRRAERPHADLEQVPEPIYAGSADDAFRYQELYAALGRLTAAERTAVLLFYMEGRPVKEIAMITGCSQQAVRQQLSRGRTHLKTLIKD